MSRAGQGSDVAERELFRQNPLGSGLGHSAGLNWGLKEAEMSLKAQIPTKPLRADRSTVLTAGYFLPPLPERSWVVPKDEDLDSVAFLTLFFLLACQLHGRT